MLLYDLRDLTAGQMEGHVHIRCSKQKACNVAFTVLEVQRYFEVRNGKTLN